MADNGSSWKKFKEKMKERRMEKTKCKKKDGKNSALNDNFIYIFSGKAQKYSRIGARVFAPFEFDDLTIENIKTACLNTMLLTLQ